MSLYKLQLYREDLQFIAGFQAIPWDFLRGSSILLSGATGMIGSLIVDCLLYKDKMDGLGCKVIALGRSVDKSKKRFADVWDSPFFRFVECDINRTDTIPKDVKADYVLHLASNTHPLAYATDPIGTITANIAGTQNLLDFSHRCGARRFLFASSNEIYGENRGDVEFFDETYCGYINCNTLRAGYSESKRCGEALCQAYLKQKGMDVVIARLTRSFGPTLQLTDSKALTQFLKNGLAKEDIVLKSAGNQFFSYTYSADAVTGLLTILLKGERGEAYNIADSAGDTKLKDLARLVARFAGTEVVFELPSETEKEGYSKVTKSRLNGLKLKSLGWNMHYDLSSGIRRTLSCLDSLMQS